MDLDAQSRRVASEIVEGGLTHLPEQVDPSWPALNEEFVALGAALAEADVGVFARSLSSVQGDEPGAIELRETVAAELHRQAAAIVAAGVRLAVTACALGGTDVDEAFGSAAWHLRSAVVEDSVPGRTTDDLFRSAYRNYVRASHELNGLRSDSAYEDFEGFAHSILGNVVGFAVDGAAGARAVEQPA